MTKYIAMGLLAGGAGAYLVLRGTPLRVTLLCEAAIMTLLFYAIPEGV